MQNVLKVHKSMKLVRTCPGVSEPAIMCESEKCMHTASAAIKFSSYNRGTWALVTHVHLSCVHVNIFVIIDNQK